MGSRRRLAAALLAALAVAAGCSGAVTTQEETTSAVLEAALGGDEVAGLPPLPEGDEERGPAGVERSALALAEALEAPRLAGEDGRAGAPCPADRLRVRWTAPGPEYEHGALAHPVGPEPAASTTLVNGAVVCEGSTFSYLGFTARWALARWIVLDVPAPDLDSAHEQAEGGPDLGDLPRIEARDVALTPLWTRRWPREIEGYAAYVPQRLCDPRPKPAVVAFTDLVLGAYPQTASWGISRACGLGGTSEHKEGRAWDWRVDAHSPAEREAAESVVSWLMATDEHGNRHAMARRLGVMYIIWNHHLWSSALHEAGWRPYGGASPHTDHVHISFTPGGAAGRTSFWRGVPLEGSGLLAPFEGIASAFPRGFSSPPARSPRHDGEAAGEREARDSWPHGEERADSTPEAGGAEEGPQQGGTPPSGSDGSEEPSGSPAPLPAVPVDPPAVEVPTPPIPQRPVAPSPPALTDPLEPLEDLLDGDDEDDEPPLPDVDASLP